MNKCEFHIEKILVEFFLFFARKNGQDLYGPNKLQHFNTGGIDFPACYFLVRVKFVYVQTVQENVQESKNFEMTI